MSDETLRDLFAAQALPALIARHRVDVPWCAIAPLAYKIADAMRAARAEQEETQDKQRWRHKQRGTTYAVEGIAMLWTAEPLSNYTQLVVYRCERTGDLWARPVSEFRDGRFEQITSQEKTND